MGEATKLAESMHSDSAISYQYIRVAHRAYIHTIDVMFFFIFNSILVFSCFTSTQHQVIALILGSILHTYDPKWDEDDLLETPNEDRVETPSFISLWFVTWLFASSIRFEMCLARVTRHIIKKIDCSFLCLIREQNWFAWGFVCGRFYGVVMVSRVHWTISSKWRFRLFGVFSTAMFAFKPRTTQPATGCKIDER